MSSWFSRTRFNVLTLSLSLFLSYLILLCFLNPSLSLSLYFFLNFTLPRSLSYLLTYSLSATFVPFSFLYSHFPKFTSEISVPNPRCVQRSPAHLTILFVPQQPLPVHHIRSIKAQTATLSLNPFLEIHQLSLFFYVELSFIDNEGRGRKGGRGKSQVQTQNRNSKRLVHSRLDIFFFFFFFFFLRSFQEKRNRKRARIEARFRRVKSTPCTF